MYRGARERDSFIIGTSRLLAHRTPCCDFRKPHVFPKLHVCAWAARRLVATNMAATATSTENFPDRGFHCRSTPPPIESGLSGRVMPNKLPRSHPGHSEHGAATPSSIAGSHNPASEIGEFGPPRTAGSDRPGSDRPGTGMSAYSTASNFDQARPLTDFDRSLVPPHGDIGFQNSQFPRLQKPHMQVSGATVD